MKTALVVLHHASVASFFALRACCPIRPPATVIESYGIPIAVLHLSIALTMIGTSLWLLMQLVRGTSEKI